MEGSTVVCEPWEMMNPLNCKSLCSHGAFHIITYCVFLVCPELCGIYIPVSLSESLQLVVYSQWVGCGDLIT